MLQQRVSLDRRPRKQKMVDQKQKAAANVSRCERARVYFIEMSILQDKWVRFSIIETFIDDAASITLN